MTALYDTGALIALERGERFMWHRLGLAKPEDPDPVTHGGVVGQAWRGGSRQALLARALPSLDIVALDGALGRRTGELLRAARTSDVVDAALVALAVKGDVIYTSDVADIAHLINVRGLDIDIVKV